MVSPPDRRARRRSGAADGAGRREWPVDLVVAVVILAAGIAVRLWNIQFLPLHFDNVDPFLRAFAWVADWGEVLSGNRQTSWAELRWPASAPWLDQFGPGLVWSYVPFVISASSLEEAFSRRYVVQALMAPALYFVVRWCLDEEGGRAAPGALLRGSHVAGFVAAVAVGFTGEPLGTAGLGDQTMVAPEVAILVLAGCALTLRGRSSRAFVVAAAALPWAVMVHPMSVALAPGFALISLVIWRRKGRVLVLAGVLLAALVSIPEVIHLSEIGGDEGGDAVAATIEITNHPHASPADIVVDSLEGWMTLEPFPLGLLLLVAPVLAVAVPAWRARRRGSRLLREIGRRTRTRARHSAETQRQVDCAVLGLVVLANLAGLLALGMAAGLLRPYHWRILLPGHALALGLVVHMVIPWQVLRTVAADRTARLVPILAACVASVVLVLAGAARLDRMGRGIGSVADHAQMARAITADAGTEARWLDSILLDYPKYRFTWTSTPAVFLEQRLGGTPRKSFEFPGALYVAVAGSPGDVEAVCGRMGWGTEPGPRRAAVASTNPDLPGAHLVDWLRVDVDADIVVVRLDTWESSRRWTGWLMSQFPAGHVRLLLDSNHTLPLANHEHNPEASWDWFDPAMLEMHFETATDTNVY